MGFRIEIGGVEVKGDTPDQTAKDALENAKKVAQTAKDAFTTGDLEKFKSLAGQLILDNNLATAGAKAAAEKVFPNIPSDSFEKVVGAGVLTFLATGDVTLTVYSVANEYLAIYPKLGSDDGIAVVVPGQAQHGPRPTKSFTVNCKKLWRNAEADGKVYLFAGFHAGPDTIFSENGGAQAIWPSVDLIKGDIVDLTATDNLAPNAEPTISRAKGIYTGQSENTNGVGPDQVTLVLIFEEE